MSSTPPDRRELIAAATARWDALRADVEAARPVQAASLGAGTFTFSAPPDARGLRPGDLVTIDSAAGILLGEVVEAGIVEEEGPSLGRELDPELLGLKAGGGQVRLDTRLTIRRLSGRGILLARAEDDTAVRPDPADVFVDAPLRPAEHAGVAAYLAAVRAGGADMEIGVARGPGGAPVHLHPDGFRRHTFLCGQSGSGKSFALGVIVERLLAHTAMRVVVLDPNSDLVRIRERRDRAGVDATRREPIDPAEFARVGAALDAALARTTVLRARGMDADAPLTTAFGRLPERAAARVLGLDPLADRDEYAAFGDAVAGIDGVPTLAEVSGAVAGAENPAARALALRIRNLGVSDWEVWTRPGEGDLVGDHLDADPRCLVVDVGTLGEAEERAVTAEALLAHLWRRRADRVPTMIVIDEAHNLCPATPQTGIAAEVVDHLVRIAAEGRTFGLFLLLASQRPTRIHPDVLTQCENLVLMRTVAQADLDVLARSFSHLPAGLVAQASGFAKGEALVGGGIVDAPFLVRFGGRLTAEGGGDVRV